MIAERQSSIGAGNGAASRVPSTRSAVGRPAAHTTMSTGNKLLASRRLANVDTEISFGAANPLLGVQLSRKVPEDWEGRGE